MSTLLHRKSVIPVTRRHRPESAPPFPKRVPIFLGSEYFSDGHHLAVTILYSGGMYMQQIKSQFKRLMKLVELIRDTKHPVNGLILSADGDFFESQRLKGIKPFIAQYRQ
jgi:hypothetical protein